MPRLPELIAHRGAPRERPENSLPGFARALAHGADGIELDVHLTTDGVPVVHHDATLGAAAGPFAGRALATLDADALSGIEIAPGVRLPRLTDVAALVGERATLYVEVKSRSGERAVHAALRPSAGAPVRYAVHSFDHRVAARSAAFAPEVPVGVLSESYLVDNVRALRDASARDLWQHWSQIDEALVAAVHAAGGRVVAWTVNDPARARDLARMDVDALCTDDVPMIRAALAGD